MSIKIIIPLLISLLFSLSINYAQTTIAKQSFEQNASDTWSMILSTPACTSGADSWDYRTSLSTITPNDGSQFWGITDLNGSCGGSNFETISLPNVDVSSFTGVDFSFDYNVKGFDPGDDMKYELFYDNVSQGEVIFVNGSSNFTTPSWVTETVTIPGSVTNVSVILYVKQNGGDYGGLDNIVLEGTLACTPSTIVSVSPNSGSEGTTVTITASSGDLTGGSVSFNGVAATITSSNTTTIVCTVPTGATSGDLTIIDSQPCPTTYSSFTVTCGPATEPTTGASNLSFTPVNCDSYTINWDNGDGANRVVIMSELAITGVPIDQTNYVANSNFGSGSTIAVGEYFVYNGSGSSVNVTGLSPNTNYFVLIFEYNGTIINCTENYLLSPSLGGSQTTLAVCPACPEVKSILVNACGAGVEEGLNEYVVFKNGASDLAVDDIKIEFPTAGSYCNISCGTNTIGNNASYITTLNTTAGCVKFKYADPIPSDATVILFAGDSPTYAYDFSTLCSNSETVIALFTSSSSGSGKFTNGGAAKSTTLTWGSCSQTVTYVGASTVGGDGAFADFDAAGTASYSNNGDCIATPLPVELSYFESDLSQKSIKLTWESVSEIDALAYEVLKSKDGVKYEYLSTVDAAGNSNKIIQYSYTDNNPNEGYNYYKLKLINIDKKEELLGITSELYSNEGLIIKTQTDNWEIDAPFETGVVELYAINGSLISRFNLEDKNIKIANSELQKGIYLLKITTKDRIISERLIK